jgi:hypothetical protein
MTFEFMVEMALDFAVEFVVVIVSIGAGVLKTISIDLLIRANGSWMNG